MDSEPERPPRMDTNMVGRILLKLGNVCIPQREERCLCQTHSKAGHSLETFACCRGPSVISAPWAQHQCCGVGKGPPRRVTARAGSPAEFSIPAPPGRGAVRA
eukprot:8701309-Pyramimonas_sp.AAC.1